jgi:prepilin-type N-terminal cleavage/methylation domain-containing protein
MSHRGTTLLELIIVIVILALLGAIAVPRVLGVTDAAAVRETAARLVAALDATRGAAVRLGGPAALLITPSDWRVLVRVGPDSVVAWESPGAAVHGVTVSGAGGPIIFARAGIAVGAANRTIVMSRGLASSRVVISRLGRVTN